MDELYDAFEGQFLQPQVMLGDWWEVEDHGETHYFDTDLFGQPDLERDGYIVIEEHKNKYGARLSASGFMDCTDWYIFDTEQEAIDYLLENYGGDFE